ASPRGLHERVPRSRPAAGCRYERRTPGAGLAIVRGAPRDYGERHPTGADTILVIEVARTSQAFDRRKASTYARSGVPVYWLIDLVARRLEVRSTPTSDGEYEQTVLLGEQHRVRLPALDLEWSVGSLFL